MTRHADLTLSVHKTRAKARETRADLLAEYVERLERLDVSDQPGTLEGKVVASAVKSARTIIGLPAWPVRISVRKAGLRQYQVVAVEIP